MPGAPQQSACVRRTPGMDHGLPHQGIRQPQGKYIYADCPRVRTDQSIVEDATTRSYNALVSEMERN